MLTPAYCRVTTTICMLSHITQPMSGNHTTFSTHEFHNCLRNVCILNIDLSPLGLFRTNETNYRDKLNRLRMPTGRRQTSWQSTSAAEELN